MTNPIYTSEHKEQIDRCIAAKLPIEQIIMGLGNSNHGITIDDIASYLANQRNDDIDQFLETAEMGAITSTLQYNILKCLLSELASYNQLNNADIQVRAAAQKIVQNWYNIYRTVSGLDIQINLDKAVQVLTNYGYQVIKPENKGKK